MMSLPFMCGFANQRWTKMVDVMLEKRRGNCKTHLLCIIGLLEADFSTALEILFAPKLMALAESAGNFHEEQSGSRKTCTSTNAALQKNDDV